MYRKSGRAWTRVELLNVDLECEWMPEENHCEPVWTQKPVRVKRARRWRMQGGQWELR